MIIDTPPFRRQITATTFTKKSRGTLPSYRHKLHNYLVFPEISINSVWRGASEIVATLALDNTANTSFFDNVPANPNYVAVISWVVSSGVVQRYKLWEDVGEILYVDLYAGQTIGANAVIEIWNTPATPTLITGFSIKSSVLSIPTCSCETIDRTTNAVYIQCVDITMDLTGWNPYRGDFYLVIDCGTTELVQGSGIAALKLQSDDGTWHNFSLVSMFGIIDYQIDQDPITAGVKGYYPFLLGGLVYPLSLTVNSGVYLYTIGAPIIDPDATISVLLQLGPNSYPVSLADTHTLVVGQDPI